MARISEILSLAGGNFARPTKYNALITLPQALNSVLEESTLDVLCKSINIPDITVEPLEVKYKGHTIPIAKRSNQTQTLEVTFYLDEFHYLRELFVDWISAIDNRGFIPKNDGNRNLYDTKHKHSTIVIKTRDHLETPENEPMNYIFQGCVPISVGGIEFSTSSLNEVMEFTVTFSFYRYYTQGLTTGFYDDLDQKFDIMGASSRPNSSISAIYSNVISSIGDTVNQVNNIGSVIHDIKGLF